MPEIVGEKYSVEELILDIAKEANYLCEIKVEDGKRVITLREQ